MIAGMKASIRKAAIVIILLILASCATVPYTGRNQLVLISPQQELALGQQAARQVLQESKVSRNPRYVEPVRRIGKRIAAVTENTGYKWQFFVVEDNTPNAFALPGGKVFVNTGMFRYANTDAQLATVIAHEVAHDLARHGAERMSTGMLAQLGGSLVAGALDIQTPGAQQAFSSAYGLATNVGVILPHSRSQETEADHIGLILMAKAGYNPQEAVEFWREMARSDEGGSTPTFLSTHPTDEQRIEDIRSFLPEAMRYYRR